MYKYFLVSLSFLLLTKIVFAQVRINEIYPAPEGANLEWVEIFNDGNDTADLSNYQLTDLAGNKLKFESNTLAPLGFSSATASGALNNTGDTVFLKKSGQTIETATYSGTFDSEDSSGKCPDATGSFFKLSPSKNSSNSSSCQILTPTPTVTPTQILTPATPSPTSKTSSVLSAEITIKPSPTQKIIPSPSVVITKNKTIPLIVKNQTIPKQIDSQFEDGEPIYQVRNQMKPYIFTLSSISISYSILTVISISIKMKFSD